MKVKSERIINNPQIIIIFVFAIGFVIGMISAFFFSKDNLEYEAQWLDSTMLYLRYGNINYNDLSFYVIKKRIGMIFILMLVCMTGYAAYLLLAGIGVFGFLTGYIITKYIIYKGIVGSIFFAVSIFPHYLCYGYVYLKLVDFMRKKIQIKEHINRTSQSEKKFEWKKMLPILVVITGIVFECYVNPIFIKIFLKIFM